MPGLDDDGFQPQRESALADLAQSFQSTYKSAEELAQAFVREAIMRGVYRPGDRLPQDVIANILGISRIPVRAGLRLLEAEGLLTIYPHRGARVSVLSAVEIRELYELRTMLECYLLELSIPKVTAQDLKDLKALANLLESKANSDGSVAVRMAFYDRLYRLAERPRVVALVSRLHGEVGQYLLVRRASEDPSGHLGLLTYVERRNVEGAKTWLRKHLAEVSEQLQSVVAEMHGAREDVRAAAAAARG